MYLFQPNSHQPLTYIYFLLIKSKNSNNKTIIYTHTTIQKLGVSKIL